MNVQSSSNYNKHYYLETWKGLLWQFLAWPERRVIEWVHESGTIDFLDDPNDIYFHQTPQYWIISLLIPSSLKNRLSASELNDLQGRILTVFKDERNFRFPADTDWTPYRPKVDEILAQYGEHLPVLSSDYLIETEA